MARFNKSVTVTAGTPVNVATGMTSAQMLSAGMTRVPQLPLNELSIQMKHGGTGLGYVMTGIRGTTTPGVQEWRVPSTANAADVTAELYPASPNAPGGQWSDPMNNQSTVWGDQAWIDVSITSDVIISYDTKG